MRVTLHAREGSVLLSSCLDDSSCVRLRAFMNEGSSTRVSNMVQRNMKSFHESRRARMCFEPFSVKCGGRFSAVGGRF